MYSLADNGLTCYMHGVPVPRHGKGPELHSHSSRLGKSTAANPMSTRHEATLPHAAVPPRIARGDAAAASPPCAD
jgi:hypothetical protein